MFHAICEKDTESTDASLATVLDQHVRLATRGSLKGLDSGLLCIPAICAGIAAARAGLTVTVAADYHSVKLPRIVASLQSWEGEPALRRKFDTVADICPSVLLAAE